MYGIYNFPRDFGDTMIAWCGLFTFYQ